MAVELPLYTDYELPIEKEQPLALDKLCTRCSLSNGSIRTVCMPPVGNPDGVFFIGDYPGKEEDTVGRPFCGSSGKYLEKQLKRWWDGPYAFGNALSCRPMDPKKVDERHVRACRGYLNQSIEDVNPKRIILTGGKAALSFFGESLPVLSARRGIGWIWTKDDNGEDEQIPVFVLMNPVNSLRNKFLKKWFEFDLKWALTSDIDNLWHPPVDSICRVIENEEDALQAEHEIAEVGGMTFDTETAGKPFNDYFKVLCLAACAYDDEDAWVWTEAALSNKKTSAPLRRLLSNPKIHKNGHNLKYDMEVTEVGLGVKTEGFHNCTLLTRKLLWSGVSGKLKHMAYLVGMGGHKKEMEEALTKAIAAINKLRKGSNKAVGHLPYTLSSEHAAALKYDQIEPRAFAYGLVKKNLLYRYCALDAIASDRLRWWQEPQLNKQKPIKRIWNKVVKGTSEAVAQVEMWGMPVSRTAVDSYNDYLNLKITEINNRFAQSGVNPASPPQLAKYLYDDLGLPCKALTEGGAPSTAKPVLKKIAKKHQAVQDVLNYRALDKLRGSYAEGIIPYIRDDGKVHPNIKIAGTGSGRASVTEPPAQTIPKGKDEHARLARGVFVAPRGQKIVQLDYSTLEIRIAALLSGDPLMQKMLREGSDFHMDTARSISHLAWGVKPDEVTDLQRGEAKTMNFSVLYGQGIPALAAKIGCTKEQAAKTMDAIFGKFKVLKAWIDERQKETYRTGFTHTWWDGEIARRRSLYQIANTGNDDASRRSQGTAKRSTYNTPVQGTAAEFCTRSLIECVNWILGDCIPAQLIMIVHDSLMFLVEDDAVEEVAHGVKDIMMSWNSLDMVLPVDVEVGQTWGNLEKYEV